MCALFGDFVRVCMFVCVSAQACGVCLETSCLAVSPFREGSPAVTPPQPPAHHHSSQCFSLNIHYKLIPHDLHPAHRYHMSSAE